jgi:hypothetical protein
MIALRYYASGSYMSVRGFFSLPKSVFRKILVFFFRLFMTKNLIFLIKFDVKIMEACAKEIILK